MNIVNCRQAVKKMAAVTCSAEGKVSSTSSKQSRLGIPKHEVKQKKDGIKKTTKYKMVRFFERQKVVRKLKQARRKMNEASDDPDRDAAVRDFDNLRKELNYIVHYPMDQKYISLYSRVETTDEGALKKRANMMDMIWSQVKNGEVCDAVEVESLGGSVHERSIGGKLADVDPVNVPEVEVTTKRKMSGKRRSAPVTKNLQLNQSKQKQQKSVTSSHHSKLNCREEESCTSPTFDRKKPSAKVKQGKQKKTSTTAASSKPHSDDFFL